MVIKRKPRDWFRVLRDLMGAGISMAKIAKLCGKSGGASTVQHWAEGGDPKDADARVVLALYRQHCPDKYEAHMREYDPAQLDYEQKVWLKPSSALRGRPRPELVGVNPSPQFDFFVQDKAEAT